MNNVSDTSRARALSIVVALAFAALMPMSHQVQAAGADSPSSGLMSYRRLLPLEGGSNFRDMGGYPTVDGRTVKRGLLFRSGAMTGLTQEDHTYLEQFGFATVMDLRSSEEIELYPNHWAANTDIDYLSVPYSILELMAQVAEEPESLADTRDYSSMYVTMIDMLKPQLKTYFDALLNEQTPIVVNCSAGQDRTGVTSALLLSVLGVDEDLVIEDYLLSTDFRRPLVESGDVDLEEAAKTNAFAAVMLEYGEGQDTSRANPLVTAQGKPFLRFTLDALKARYGSIEGFLTKELGLGSADLQRLRDLYLTQ